MWSFEVLSPPCGMVTFPSIGQFLTSTMSQFTSSEPTVWDGDITGRDASLIRKSCSEPTVWDGDTISANPNPMPPIGSEPTVWDGDF